jgi:hypothetical protein
VSAVVLLACLVASGFLLNTAPSAEDQQAPMRVTGAHGETTLAGRNLEATIGTVTIVEVPYGDSGSRSWDGLSSGQWIAVEVRAECVVEFCSLAHAELAVGEETWSASDRSPLIAMRPGEPLMVEIPREGTLLFEVPDDIAESDGSAELRLGTQADTRLDSLLVFALDLGASALAERLEIRPVDFAGSLG